MLPGLGSMGPIPGIENVSSGHASFDLGGIPGMDAIQRLLMNLGLDPSLLVTLGMSLTLLTSLLSFFTYSIGSLSTLTRFISANLVSSATIHSSDVTYLYVMRWLAVQKISTDCRLFCVTSRKNPLSFSVRRFSSYAPYGDGNRGCQDDEDGDEESTSEDDALGPKLKYTPAPGFFWFWYMGRPIIINRKLDLTYFNGDMPDETIELTTIGRSPAFLREILNDARRDYLQAQSRKTMVYTLSPTPFAQKTWDQGRHRPSRDLSTVIMPPEEKMGLLQDVREYLNPVTMRWYAQRGLPYRRGYLFWGPPGTGKTSLSLALAGELKLPLYILSLSTGSLTDETLTVLFVGLPKRCIVLLEDIDCAGVHRNGENSDDYDSDSSDEDDDDEDDGDGKNGKGGSSGGGGSQKKGANKGGNNNGGGSNMSSKGRQGSPPGASHGPDGSRRPRISVSFSGLLNAIDGVASHEGRILIMTTNHRERLDSALIRPGRVDIQVEFGYACKETLSEIFRELYKEIGGRTSGGSTGIALPALSGGISSEKKSAESLDRDSVCRLADEFAKRIPENRFTPAEIQGYLMSYKGKPEKALENIDHWVHLKTKVEREKAAKAKRKAVIAAEKQAKLEAEQKKQMAAEEEKQMLAEQEKQMAATIKTATINNSVGIAPDTHQNVGHEAHIRNILNTEQGQSLMRALLQLLGTPLPVSEGAVMTAPSGDRNPEDYTNDAAESDSGSSTSSNNTSQSTRTQSSHGRRSNGSTKKIKNSSTQPARARGVKRNGAGGEK